jgi:7,8-dihydropterin-6-yl-methyl-4-(beta-D-ribofuranosyl)aminobenzene 5'-phosphate synthase
MHSIQAAELAVLKPPEYIERTVTELTELKPDVVLPVHCSGADFIESMRRRIPDQLVTTNVGARFTFGV